MGARGEARDAARGAAQLALRTAGGVVQPKRRARGRDLRGEGGGNASEEDVPNQDGETKAGVNDYACAEHGKGRRTHQRVRVRVLGVARNHRNGV